MIRFRQRLALLVGCLVCFAVPAPVLAGMPSPLPTDYQTVSRLTDTAYGRFQAISFFAAAVLLSAAVVRWLWNFLQHDFPKLPRLSYPKALVGVLLWGLLFVIVLTMISGARELLTPGAWKKDGATYKLAGESKAATSDSADRERRQQLEGLKAVLWQYAATHEGRFPASLEASEVPTTLRQVPEGGGLHYLYVSNLAALQPPTVLVYEPEIDAKRRFALLTNGEIVCLTSTEIGQFVMREERP